MIEETLLNEKMRQMITNQTTRRSKHETLLKRLVNNDQSPDILKLKKNKVVRIVIDEKTSYL